MPMRFFRRHAYSALTAAPSDTIDGEDIGVVVRKRYPLTIWIFHALLLTTSISVFAAGLWAQQNNTCARSVAANDYSYERLYSPIWEAVHYERKVFYSNQESHSAFMGHPREELDEAWANITTGYLILLNETGIEALNQSTENASNIDGQYFALPEYYHQMHCLDIIRKYMFRESYPDFAIFQRSEEAIWAHVDHCIDLMRQLIMCSADVGLIIYYLEGDGEPVARFATEHMCRNLDMINTWVKDHAWEQNDDLARIIISG